MSSRLAIRSSFGQTMTERRLRVPFRLEARPFSDAPLGRGPWSDVQGQLVDLGRRDPIAGVNLLNGLGARRLREAKDLAGHGICPGVLEVDALVGLDRQVTLVRGEKRVRGDPHHPL